MDYMSQFSDNNVAFVCRHCNEFNIMPLPYKGEKVDVHMKLPLHTAANVKAWCAQFHGYENGITMMLYYAKEYQKEKYKSRFSSIPIREVSELPSTFPSQNSGNSGQE